MFGRKLGRLLTDMGQDMKIPEPILDYLRSKRIVNPTPIQLQGIPVAYVFLIIQVSFSSSKSGLQVVMLLVLPSLARARRWRSVFLSS